MNKKTGLCFILALLALSYGYGFKDSLPKNDSIFYKMEKKVGKKLGKRHDMIIVALGLGGGKSHDRIHVMFQRRHHPTNMEQSRKIIVDCVNEFLKEINQNDELKPFLKVYPLSAKNIDLDILNYSEDYEPYYEPYIFSVSSVKGNIYYVTKFPEIKGDVESEKEETFEEAVAILEKENLSRTPQ